MVDTLEDLVGIPTRTGGRRAAMKDKKKEKSKKKKRTRDDSSDDGAPRGKHEKHEKQKKKEKSKKKKRKRDDSSDSSSSSEDRPAPPAPAAPTLPSFADLYPMPRRRAGPIAAGPIAALPASAGELQRRNERAERFLPSAADLALAAARTAASAPAYHANTQGGALRGQSVMLEKSYMRLTTLPNAADVRPLPVLREAFELVQRKWEAERDYVYACDMLKAIRQDLTVQHLTQSDGSRADFALRVYEAHATIALQSGDLGEFGACQAALVPLHATRRSPRAAEFVACTPTPPDPRRHHRPCANSCGIVPESGCTHCRLLCALLFCACRPAAARGGTPRRLARRRVAAHPRLTAPRGEG
jgi:hypothetical protein